MKVWITKHALTRGIEEVEVITTSREYMVQKKGAFSTYYIKPDWHIDKESAIERAENMRIVQIKDLNRRIKDLEKKSFREE